MAKRRPNYTAITTVLIPRTDTPDEALIQSLAPPEPPFTGREKPGPAPTPLRWDKLAEAAALFASQEEAALHAGTSTSSLIRWFRRCDTNWENWSQPHRNATTILLRRQILDRALAGNDSMLTMLAKRFLGMGAKNVTEITGPDGGPILHAHIHGHGKLSDEDLDRMILNLNARHTPLLPNGAEDED